LIQRYPKILTKKGSLVVHIGNMILKNIVINPATGVRVP